MAPRKILQLLIGVLVVVAGACAHADVPNRFNRETWQEAVAKKRVDVDFAVYPFDATPEMESWVREALRGHTSLSVTGQLEVLQDAMFGNEFDFNYEDDLTLTASEAFRQRRGNCMAFTALFIALSRSAGMPTFLMTVRRAPSIDREDDLVVVNRHVVAGYRTSQEVEVYDFYVTSSTPFLHQRMVDDVMASAMYHNNLGGAAIRSDELELAIRHLETAATLAPDWSPAWVNLGVARFRLGDTVAAVEAYQRALEVEPNSPSAFANLAYVYRQTGRDEEAEMALQAAAQRTRNPFTLIAMADAEMVRGDLAGAGRYLRKAKRSYRKEPEVYDALARLSRLKGDPDKARRYVERADKLRRREAEESN
jgi:Flp pilus assembly protein TadD